MKRLKVKLVQVLKNFMKNKITKKDANKGYMIANNKGFENGWTKTIYGYVIQIEK